MNPLLLMWRLWGCGQRARVVPKSITRIAHPYGRPPRVPRYIHRRFSRWAQSGVWERVFQLLAADADNEYAMIDSTIVRAHQHSAGAQKKPARTKRSGARAAD